MFKFTKQKETPAIIYRIRELYKKVSFLNNCKGSSNYAELWSIYNLNTAYGKRKLQVTYGSISYFDETDKLFTIEIYPKNKVKISPFPTDLTYDEIDLAILEFEKAIDNEYNLFLKKAEYHRSVERELNSRGLNGKEIR